MWTSIALLIALMSLSIWAVVHLRIQRPLGQMIEVVRSVSRGDLSLRTNADGKDELAELAREFDAMVTSLEQTRARLSREAELRERLEADMARANRLAIVGGLAATLVTDHEGVVEVEDRPVGRGTRFVVHLPLDRHAIL